MEKRKAIFDFSKCLNIVDIRKEVVYLSSSGGVAAWSYPVTDKLDWSNHLTGIIDNGNYEFNFVFKNGDAGNATMSGKAKPVVSINPPNSVVKKVVVGYD